MNPEQKSPEVEEISDAAETNNTLSIDEFFRQLEAKEKDLDISAEMVIEVEEPEVGDQDISDFLQMDVSVAPHKSDAPNKIEMPAIAAVPQIVPPPKHDDSHLKAEINNLQNQIARMETERIELFELARRRQNDFESYKNRTERERSETFRNQLSNLATQMLPVVDNLNRAMDLSDAVGDEKTKEFQQFFEGIVLVSQQLNEILAEMGVQPILAVGEHFDPHFHEAVATEVTDKHPSQTVTEELLRGYRIGDKVIRPSMVKVSVTTTTGSLPPLSPITGNGFSNAE